MNRQTAAAVFGAIGLTIPWVTYWILTIFTNRTVEGLATNLTVLISGLSVLGAAFLLAWAAETAERDVPRPFAIAVLAVLAVAPEYSVGALYAWNAGAFAGTARAIEAGNLAVANMTGANRILIGLGWTGIVLFTVYRRGAAMDPSVEDRAGRFADVVQVDRDLALDIVFLLAATLWAFFVPLFGGIDALDMVVLVGIYVTYILVVLRGDIEPVEDHVGVPASLQAQPRWGRVLTVVVLFAFSGLMIFTAVEPFAHGLETIGTDIGVPAFFMIQWIAPLASEAPELVVVVYLVNKARSTAGFNALISSKLNQWTLLIGTFVVVYSIAYGQYGVLSFHAKQAAEIWLTAAQSFFALAILANFEISVREALALLVLFVSQVGLEFLIIRDMIGLPFTSHELLIAYTGLYVVLGALLMVIRRQAVLTLFQHAWETIHAALPDSSGN